MDTTKILGFRHPSQATLLLDSFVASLEQLSSKARKLTVRSDLPAALQKIAIRATNAHRTWGAWRDGDLLLFIIAESSSEDARKFRCPVLLLSFYNTKGQLRDKGLWVNTREGCWKRAQTTPRVAPRPSSSSGAATGSYPRR